MADVASRIAQPGDPDLDCDVRNLTITAVISTDRQEVELRLLGGTGRWIDHDSGDMLEGLRVTESHISMYFPTMPAAVFADYLDQLHEWRDAGTLLGMTSAPGRASLLFDLATGKVIPLPSNWPPPDRD